MKPPSSFVSLAGAPWGAGLLYCLAAAVVVGWYAGGVPGWLAVWAVIGALRTLAAAAEVKRYRAWQAAWKAMEGGADVPQSSPKRSRREVRIIGVAVIALAIIPSFLSSSNSTEADAGLKLLWAAVFGYVVLAVIWLLVRRTQPVTPPTTKPVAEIAVKAAPVSWLLECADASASRAEAARELPEYCVRLLQQP